jgi:hypothetical protein
MTPATSLYLFLAMRLFSESNLVGVLQIRGKGESVSLQSSESRRKPPFEFAARADVTDKDDGTRFALNSYRARDGVMVSKLHGSIESAARAEYYFNKNVHRR